MKKLLSSKRREAAAPPPVAERTSASSAQQERLHLGERSDEAAALEEENLRNNPFTASDNPFLADPFGPAAAAEGQPSEEEVVAAILRDHRSAGSAASSRQLQEVPLFDVHGGGGEWEGGGAAAGAAGAHAEGRAEEPFESRLPLGNPFLASAAAEAEAGQLGGSNPFLAAGGAAEAKEPPALEEGRAQSHWSMRGSAAEQYKLATPMPQHAQQGGRGGGGAAGVAGSRNSLGSMGVTASDSAWDADSPAPPGPWAAASKKGRGLRLWGHKGASAPSPPLPISHPPSFSTMLPPPTPPGASAAAGNGVVPAAAAARSESAWSHQLDQRDAELARREADVARREAALSRAGAGAGIKVKNWPRFYPLFHHDIAGEVPPGRHALLRTGYAAWLIVCTAYLWNWLVITIMFGSGEKSVSLWLFASIVAGAGVPLSFLCWYRSLYFAAIKDSALRWGWYFLHMAVNLVWLLKWMFVGVEPKLGGYSAGLFTMIEQFSSGGGKGTAFGILSIINMVLWGVGGLLAVYLLGWGMRVFRGWEPSAARASTRPGAVAAQPAGPTSWRTWRGRGAAAGP